MKIAFLLTQSLDSPGGLGRFGPLARQLSQLGHEVELFALHPNWSDLKIKNFVDEGVQVTYVGQMHLQKTGSQKHYFSPQKLLWIAFIATFKLAYALWKSKAEVIQICKPHPMNSLAALLASRGRKIYCDCDDYEAAVGNFSNPWQQRIVAWFEKQMAIRAQRVTTNTFFMRDQIASWGVPDHNIIYLPNGIDRQRFRTQDPIKVEELRRKLDLENKHVVAYIGTLALASHAVDLLLDAFPIVLQDVPDSVLLVLGGGEDLQKLQAYGESLGIAGTIRWIGKVPPDSVPLYYQLANVTADPVRDDYAARGRAPLKLFESWACGIPFVSADIGDRRRLLGDPLAGSLCLPDNPQSLADAIVHLLQNPVERSKISALGLDRVQNYNWDKLTRILEAVYKNEA